MRNLPYDDNDRFSLYAIMDDKFQDLSYYRERYYTAREFMNERIPGCPLLLITAALDLNISTVETYRETGTRKVIIRVRI